MIRRLLARLFGRRHAAESDVDPATWPLTDPRAVYWLRYSFASKKQTPAIYSSKGL